jgi:hypothetical protein
MKRRFLAFNHLVTTEAAMRQSYKIILFLALAVLASLSCEAVTGLGQNTPPAANGTPVYVGGDPVFKPEQLPRAQVGADYTARVTVENTRTPVGDFSLQDGELPPGLTLKQVEGVESTAEITGTPSKAGTYKFTIYIWCYGTQRAGQTAQQEYEIVVEK